MINYEQEVKKIHKDAWTMSIYRKGFGYMWCVVGQGAIKLSDNQKSESAAWQSAYETLNQQPNETNKN